MSKIAILGDTHHGMRGDSIHFHNYFKKFYDDIFFPYLIENKITYVYQLGDLFDRRKFINFNSLYLSKQYFFDRLKQNNIKMITLLGNHDISYKNTLEVNSSELLLESYDNIEVINKFTTKKIYGIDVDIIPWICDENKESIFESIKSSKSQLCFGHFEIDGFEMDRGNVHFGGLDRKELSKYDMVLSGHFHHKSDNGHIYYVGTPGEMTWSDYNDPRGFHILDLHNRTMEFIRNPYNIFNKVIYNDDEQDLEYWKKYDFKSLKDSYIKIVVVNKQNPFLFDNVVDNLFKVGVIDISIVEDFIDLSIEEDKDIIDQAEDTFTVLSKYIDNLTLDVEKHKLKNIMRELYVEALNVQITE